MVRGERRGFVHLAYLDDSGSDKPSPIVVVGAVVVEDSHFWKLDLDSAVLVEDIVSEEKRETFEEFHAAHLFGGYESFKDLDQAVRHDAIGWLLNSLKEHSIPFIYAAVDKRALEKSAFASSLSLDVAFRICACGVADWNTKIIERDGQSSIASRPYLLIADDTDDKAAKHALRTSFRSLRPKSHSKDYRGSRFWMCHDEMYFGDSKSSVGIQLADLCAHV